MFDFDWPRISRWCLLGTVVMLLWLLVPVARCSWGAFRDTPLDEIHPDDPADTDSKRVEQGQGFFSTLTTGVKVCYKRTPLLGQEPWKGALLLGFGGLFAATWLLGRWEKRRKSTFADRR